MARIATGLSEKALASIHANVKIPAVLFPMRLVAVSQIAEQLGAAIMTLTKPVPQPGMSQFRPQTPS